jgi:hypothetical protein
MTGTIATIIAGRFEEKERADAAIRQLQQAGTPGDRYTSFFVGPPGQHDRFPTGGDQDESPGAREADSGALKGAGVGAAVGLGVGVAATPVAGPIAAAAGAGVGAYVGSLVGALKGMGSGDGNEQNQPVPARKSGFLVAVKTNGAVDDERQVIRLLESAGAHDIERAQGQWVTGRWTDFDPTRPPVLVTPPATAT